MKAMMNLKLDENLNLLNDLASVKSLSSQTLNTATVGSVWNYWQNDYYPNYIRSYPVYLHERARDKGKEAFEIIKMLKDKKFLKLETVGDFIDVMDELIKIL